MEISNVYHGHLIVTVADPDAAAKEAEVNRILNENAAIRDANSRLPKGANPAPEIPVPELTGQRHGVFPLKNARRDGPGWKWDSIGDLVGTFDHLGQAIAEAKRRRPPEPMPRVESVTVIEEKEGE